MAYYGTIGCAVLPYCTTGLAGRVGKRFSTCVHLQADDLIVTLGNERLPRHPFTVSMVNYPEGIAEGTGFRIDNWQLRLDGCRHVDLGGMKQFWPRQHVSAAASREKIREGLALGRACFDAAAVTEGLAGLLVKTETPNCFVDVAGPWVEKIRHAIRSGNWRQWASAAQHLAGLGPGLTPSGDDLLCGMLAGLRFHRESCGEGPGQGLLDGLARAVAGETTPFCAQMIKAAGRGLVSGHQANWLKALYRGDFSSLEKWTKRLLAFGHSSGSDLLCGMFIALESVTEGTL